MLKGRIAGCAETASISLVMKRRSDGEQELLREIFVAVSVGSQYRKRLPVISTNAID
jgi:hypothetical protein